MESNNIRIVWIPNQLSKDGRIEKFFGYENGKTLSQYLDDTGFDYKKKGIVLLSSQKGRIDDPVTYVPQSGEEVLVMPDVRDPISMALGIGWALTASITASMSIGTMISVAYTVGALVMVGALAVVGYAIFSAFQKPKSPSFGAFGGVAGGSMDEASPTYGWDGVRTIMDVGVPIGVVYGTHKVGGNIINQYVYNDGTKEYLNLLIGLCEGEIESISDIKINENPYENYTGMTKYERLGTNDQSVITGFEELHQVYDIGAMLVKDTPYTTTSIETQLEAFEVEISFPYGLYKINSSGDMVDETATYILYYKKHSDEIWTELAEKSVTGKSRTAVKSKTKVTGLDPDQYDVKVMKTSDAGTASQSNDMRFARLDEIKNDDLAYPNTVLLGMKLLATDQLSGSTPQVSCIVKGTKIKTYKVMNGETEVAYEDYYYDPATDKFKLFSDDTELSWDGETYSTAFCANPVWCIYDLLTNARYGLGEFIDASQLDLAQFVDMAKYCDERLDRGDDTFEKRFVLDCVIDASHSALDILLQLCATFRAWAFYSQGAVKLKIDKPETPVQLFGMGNIVEGSFQQGWKSVKDVPNVIEVQFINALQNYEQEVIAVTDEDSLATNPMRKKAVRIFTTSISRALREGRYAKNLAKYIHRSISFKASVDAVACQSGDVISVSHELPAWGNSGRVVSGTDFNVTTDKSVTIESGKTYRVRVRHQDDTIEERTVINPAGTATVLQVSTAFTQVPAEADVWAFGETSLLKKDFRIINIKREGNHEVAIEAIEYSALVYDDTAPALPENNYEEPEDDIPNVTDIVLGERVVRAEDGTIQHLIDVFWNKPDTTGYPFRIYKSAKIYISSNGGSSYLNMGESEGTSFSINTPLVNGQTYRICITTVTYDGRESSFSASPTADIVITGKTEPPEDITTFLAYQRRDSIVFGWAEVTDDDLWGYEIRKGVSWEGGIVIATKLTGKSYVSGSLVLEDDQSFWIKAIDTTGNYSATAKEATLSVETIPFSNIIMTWQEENDATLSFQDVGSLGFDDVSGLRFNDTAYCGIKSNLEVSGSSLVFSSGQISGTYTTLIRDVGYVAPFRISIAPVFTLSNDDRWDSFGTDTFQTNTALRFSGVEVGLQMSVRIRTSEDNLTWSEWMAWEDADFYCRYFQLEFTFTRESTDQAVGVSSLHITADLPDVDEFGADEITDANAGKEIVFTKTFSKAPMVAISILDGDGRVSSFSVAPTITGFTVKLYKLDGTAVTGSFAYHAHGV